MNRGKWKTRIINNICMGKDSTIRSIRIRTGKRTTAWKVFKYGVFSGRNTEKYGPQKTPYLDTFHAVSIIEKPTQLLYPMDLHCYSNTTISKT